MGTTAALALAGCEALAFLNAAALYVLSRAEVQGLEVHDLERRRTLVLAILLGDSGAKSVQEVAQRTGTHWARKIVESVPAESLRAINKVLGQHFVTKYGTKQGIVVLGRVVPFGIGAVIGGGANAVFSQGLITAADKAFGKVPEAWVLPAAAVSPGDEASARA